MLPGHSPFSTFHAVHDDDPESCRQAIDDRVLTVLVVVVPVQLADVVGRVADDYGDRRTALAGDVLGVLLGEHRQLAVLSHVQGVHEAEPLERLIFAGDFQVGMLNVEGRDVIRHEHDFIGEQLLTVDARQVAAGDASHQVDDEVAGAGAGVKDVHAGRGWQGERVKSARIFWSLRADFPSRLYRGGRVRGAPGSRQSEYRQDEPRAEGEPGLRAGRSKPGRGPGAALGGAAAHDW